MYNTKVSPFNQLAETTLTMSHLMFNTKVRSINLLKQHKSQVVHTSAKQQQIGVWKKLEKSSDIRGL
jgi:hypothetical protein